MGLKCHGSSFKKTGRQSTLYPDTAFQTNAVNSRPETWPVVISPFSGTQKGLTGNFILTWLRVRGQCLPTHHLCKLDHRHQFPGTSNSREAVSGRSRGWSAVFLPGLTQVTLLWMHCLKGSMMFKKGRQSSSMDKNLERSHAHTSLKGMNQT